MATSSLRSPNAAFPVLACVSLLTAACADLPLIAQPRTTGSEVSAISHIAIVNGKPITQSQFDRTLLIALTKGAKDSPELRRSIRKELVNRELLAQEAVRLKLDNTENSRYLLTMSRQATLVEIMASEHLKSNPISDSDLQAEYQRQLEALHQRGGTQQYRLRQITVPSEADALNAMARLRKGESMESIAHQISIAPSKEQGGLLDWLSPLQMLPEIANVVTKLEPGGLAATPIRIGNSWSLIKIEEKRAFQPPNEKQVRTQLRDLLIAERRANLIKQLRSNAQITE